MTRCTSLLHPPKSWRISQALLEAAIVLDASRDRGVPYWAPAPAQTYRGSITGMVKKGTCENQEILRRTGLLKYYDRAAA